MNNPVNFNDFMLHHSPWWDMFDEVMNCDCGAAIHPGYPDAIGSTGAYEAHLADELEFYWDRAVAQTRADTLKETADRAANDDSIEGAATEHFVTRLLAEADLAERSVR